jgi:hypothetical protein
MQKLFPLKVSGKYYGNYCRACYMRRELFMTSEEFDWTYYYAELTKAKSDRIKWFMVGVCLGGAVTAAILLTFLNF